ncbi:MAG: protein tyrosine phosphatase [Clostridiales bacterium]|nr:protein tyrosine phosphatase [Clostridiales bacterium]
MQKLLFLCSQNRRRSLTAEKIFNGYQNCKAYSAGTESNARVKVTAGMLGWADIIFCMEKKHVRRIKEKYADEIREKKVVCLNIPDVYENMDKELQEILMSSVEEYID